MATQQGLYDVTALAVELLTDLTKAFGMKDDEVPKGIIAPLQNALETRLKKYDAKYEDLVALYTRLKNDSESKKVSYTQQISDLMKEVQRQKDKNEEDVERTAALYRQQRDEVTRAADRDQAAMVLERANLEAKKKEAKDEIDQYKRQTQEAVEDRAKTIKLWEEECDRSTQLMETIESLRKAQGDLEYEVAGWKEESARETTAEQEKKIKALEEELQVTTEQLEAYKAKSRQSTPDNDPAGNPAFNELAKTDSGDSGTSTPKSGGALSRSAELQREKDKNQELKATIETDYVSREVHEKTVKEAADLKAERDRLQNAATNCQEALKKLQDEVSKKDGAKIKELKAKIRDLEKQIKAFEDGANTHRADFARQKDRIQDLEKQLKAAKDRIAKLEKVERELQTKVASQQTRSSDLKTPEAVAKLEEELRRVQEELRNTTQELTELRNRNDSHLDRLAAVENERHDLQMQHDALERLLEQRNDAQDWLQEDLLEAIRARDRLQAGVDSLLEPDIDVASLQVFSEQVLDLVRLRQRAFNMVERVIELSVRAADEYHTVTGTGFVVHGHGTTDQGRRYITEADAFERDFQKLYTTLLDSIRDAQGQIAGLRNQVTEGANNAIAQETVDAMQKQIDALSTKNKDLEQSLKTCQVSNAKYNNPGANQSQIIRDIRERIKGFLTIASPSLQELDKLLADMVGLQKMAPGVTPFGQEAERKAGQLEETLKQLEKCRAEGTKLQERNKAIQSTLDNLQGEHSRDRERLQAEAKRLQAQVARLTAELKALRDTRNQDQDEARKQLEKQIGKISAQLQTLTDESNEERTKHAKVVTGLTNQLEATQARLEQERTTFADGNKRRDDDMKVLRDASEAEATRLGNQITRLTGESQLARESCERERKQLEAERNRLANELKTLQTSSDRERGQHANEVRRLNAELQALRDTSLEDRRRLGDDLARVNGELQASRNAGLQERQRLEAEVARLNMELQTLRDSTDQERRRLEAEVARLTTELQTLRDTSEQERQRLEGEVTRLNTELQTLRDATEQERQRLEAEAARVNAELATLRDTLGLQNDVIGNNGQQANRTQVVLNGQIGVFGTAQRDLLRSIENMTEQATAQGRSAAETARTLTRARREIAMFQTLVQELTVQRDLLQDEVNLCEEAQRRGRQRLRDNAAAAPAPAPAPAAGARPAGARPAGAAGAGNAVVAARRRRGLVAGTGDFIGRTYSLFLRTVQYSTVWGTLGTIFVMMCAVIIAEGRQYAQWQDANAHSRALWMTVRDRPTLCLGPPNIDYFWHTLVVVLTGRWTFR